MSQDEIIALRVVAARARRLLNALPYVALPADGPHLPLWQSQADALLMALAEVPDSDPSWTAEDWQVIEPLR